VSFLAAITIVTGLLAMGDRGQRSGFLAAANTVLIPTAAAAADTDPIFDTAAPLDRQRWTGIVIHHSGQPAGDIESLTRLHESYGYSAGLGYHFVIGNGNGLGDGVIHVGNRWNQQLPGAHTAGPTGAAHNQHSIGICLIGNGDRRPFTPQQMAQLVSLVRRLQRELDIPAQRVWLHREIAPGLTDSPGRLFAAGEMREQLAN
jgi:hypothetical protein